MKEGPDIALIGSLIGDPARANMLAALMAGKALTATELSAEAGITPQTASAHLRRLEESGLLIRQKQGRHRYYALADAEVGNVLETIMNLAANRGHLRTNTGPKDPALREARICYDHLAGEKGVRIFDSLIERSVLQVSGDGLALTERGRVLLSGMGIDLAPLERARRPLCRTCLDWSARRSHLAGSLGAAFLDRIIALKWARREPNSRILAFSRSGEQAFAEAFPVKANPHPH